MAVDATLHCITGCSIGEILGLTIGSIANLSNPVNIALSITLSFIFGYMLSTLPLASGGMPWQKAFKLVLAADTLSILVMEIVDNTVMAIVPGAMNANLVNPLYWITMPVSLMAAFLVAVPVNQYLMGHGRGHALVHENHNASNKEDGL
jgi:pilus assembly protein TadC